MTAKLEGYKMYAGWKSKALRKAEAYVDAIMRENILEARDDAIRHIIENDSVVTRELSRADSFEIVKEKGTDLNISYSMRNVMPYASYVERGTAPHFVPLNVLIHYVMVKRRLSRGDAWPIAVAIQRSILAHGTHPKPFMRPAFEKMRVKLKKDLKRFSSETGIAGRPFTRLYYGE